VCIHRGGIANSLAIHFAESTGREDMDREMDGVVRLLLLNPRTELESSSYLQRRWAFRLGMRLLAPILVSVALGTACQGSGISIDWVDFVQFHGVTYGAAWTSPGRPLQQGDLGPQYGIVKVKLAASQDPNHRIQDGDAGFLDPGTAVYAMKGYSPSFRLAAYDQGRLTLYEADTNPKAKVGADLLDLVNVRYIGINSAQDGHTELAAVHSQDQVNALIGMVLKSPVDQTLRSNAGPQYFIDFHFNDGTETTRSYWPTSGELSRGILLPPAFASVVTDALNGAAAALPTGQPGSFVHVQIDVPYAFRLYTHCGADWRTFFDGSYWGLAAPVQLGLGDPYQDGAMTLVAANEARFDYHLDGEPASISFTRHALGAPLKPPVGCD
jgi:hypothetical protein